MLSAQVAKGCKFWPTQLSLSAKSPLAEYRKTTKSAVPVFVNVTTWAALLVPITWAVKLKDADDRLTTGAAEAIPVPDRVTIVDCWPHHPRWSKIRCRLRSLQDRRLPKRCNFRQL